MIPVLIGTAVVAAGAAALSGDDSDKNFEPTEKHEVSEQYVKKCLKNAGKEYRTYFKTNYSTNTSASNFNVDFERIEKKLKMPRKSNDAIKAELNSIEWRAKQRRDAIAMNFIAFYYNKVHCNQDADRCYKMAVAFGK